MKIIESLFILVVLILLLRACSNETSISYEAGKEYKDMKSEFIKRYHHILEDFDGDDSKFLDFDEFVDNHILISPKVFPQLLNVCINKIASFLKAPGKIRIDERTHRKNI